MSAEGSRRQCEFQLLRYVPDPVRNEFVHIGVILRDTELPGDGKPPRLEVRFTRDWRRVRCLDPDADTALLEAMESEMRLRLQQEAELEESSRKLTRLLDESMSMCVQVTQPRAYLAESVPAGMEELMRLYVEAPPRERVSRLRGRAAIQASMRGEFERAGVWDLLRKQIPAAQYTRPGDPLRLDAGYRVDAYAGGSTGGAHAALVRIFHAVSLEPGVEMAKVLAFSAAGLRAGVERLDKAALELTAIIEPAARVGAVEEEPERLALYRFGVETMEEHQIRVLTTSDLPRVAAAARRELGIE